MNKYDILEEKLTSINTYIDSMYLESNTAKEYLKQYKEYVNKLREENRKKITTLIIPKK